MQGVVCMKLNGEKWCKYYNIYAMHMFNKMWWVHVFRVHFSAVTPGKQGL